MRKPRGAAVNRGDQVVEILRIRAEEPGEGGGIDRLGQGGVVEIEVIGLEAAPVCFVCGAERADHARYFVAGCAQHRSRLRVSQAAGGADRVEFPTAPGVCGGGRGRLVSRQPGSGADL